MASHRRTDRPLQILGRENHGNGSPERTSAQLPMARIVVGAIRLGQRERRDALAIHAAAVHAAPIAVGRGRLLIK